MALDLSITISKFEFNSILIYVRHQFTYEITMYNFLSFPYFYVFFFVAYAIHNPHMESHFPWMNGTKKERTHFTYELKKSIIKLKCCWEWQIEQFKKKLEKWEKKCRLPIYANSNQIFSMLNIHQLTTIDTKRSLNTNVDLIINDSIFCYCKQMQI